MFMGYNTVWVFESQPTFRRNMLPPFSGLKSKPSKKPPWSSRHAEIHFRLVFAWLSFHPRRWRWYIPQKRHMGFLAMFNFNLTFTSTLTNIIGEFCCHLQFYVLCWKKNVIFTKNVSIQGTVPGFDLHLSCSMRFYTINFINMINNQ
jgi:hypothetical protein